MYLGRLYRSNELLLLLAGFFFQLLLLLIGFFIYLGDCRSRLGLDGGIEGVFVIRSS